eukprot:3939722-Rhodomonas_salina.1
MAQSSFSELLALATREQLPDIRCQVVALKALGWICFRLGRFDSAAEHILDLQRLTDAQSEEGIGAESDASVEETVRLEQQSKDCLLCYIHASLISVCHEQARHSEVHHLMEEWRDLKKRASAHERDPEFVSDLRNRHDLFGFE